MSGSSFATPHVAGMAALLLQLRPNWQVADIKQQLHHPETMLGVLQNAPGH
jgi:subtilisin family serine protease